MLGIFLIISLRWKEGTKQSIGSTFCNLIDICSFSFYFIYKRTGGSISQIEFQLKLGENLILKYIRTEEGLSADPQRPPHQG
jgi:hypothetical protein